MLTIARDFLVVLSAGLLASLFVFLILMPIFYVLDTLMKEKMISLDIEHLKNVRNILFEIVESSFAVFVGVAFVSSVAILLLLPFAVYLVKIGLLSIQIAENGKPIVQLLWP